MDKPRYSPKLTGVNIGNIYPKATLVITHAGMNTTLAALSSGVPLVAIPITNEQPGIASRIANTGAGEVVPLKRLNVPRLRDVIRLVLAEDSYKRSAL